MMTSRRSGYSEEHYTTEQLNYLKDMYVQEISTLGATLDRSQRSWMHVNPASDGTSLKELEENRPHGENNFCVVCDVCSDSIGRGYMPIRNINLQVPVIKVNAESYNMRRSPIMEKYADGWNHPMDCECRTTGSPWMHGTVLHGRMVAPTRNNSPDMC